MYRNRCEFPYPTLVVSDVKMPRMDEAPALENQFMDGSTLVVRAA
jgi:CheY-like chemotaxis protein